MTRSHLPVLALCAFWTSCSQNIPDDSVTTPSKSLRFVEADPTRFLPETQRSSFITVVKLKSQPSLLAPLNLPPLPTGQAETNFGLLPPINGHPSTVETEQTIPEAPAEKEMPT